MTDTADWSMFPAMPPELQQAIVAAAQKSGMPPALLANHLWNESRGNSSVPAGDGGKSFGVMQIQGPTLADYNAKHGKNYTTADISDPQHPEVGIAVGAQHWADLRDQYNDPRLASLAYAWGPAKTEAWSKAGGDWNKLPPQVREIMGNVYGPHDFPGAAPVPEAVATVQRANTVAAADPFSAAFSGKVALPAPPPAAAAGDTTPTVTVTAKQPAADAFSAAFSGKPSEAKPAVPTLEDVIGSPDALAADVPQSQTPNPALARVGDAAVQAYQNTPSVLTPTAQAAVDQGGPVGRWIVNPALRAAGGVAAGANALTAGGAQAVTETAGALGVPALGRDVNMLAQVAPVAHMGAGAPSLPRGVQEAPPAPRFVQEYYGEGLPGNPLASPGEVALATSTRNPLAAQVPSPAFVPPGASVPLLDRITQLIQADNDVAANRPAFIPTAAAQPPNPLSAPAPRTVPSAALAPVDAAASRPAPALAAAPPVALQSVGAAASREQTPGSLVDMTPKQVQAYRSTAEGQKLLEPQQPGVADPNIYVPGVTPNAAEIEQTVNTSRELKALNISAPEVSQEAKEVAAANNEARQQYFANVARSDVDVVNAKAARQEDAATVLPRIWKAATTPDLAPVVDEMQAQLSSPRGKQNTQLKQYVAPLLDRLIGKDGAPKITDAEELYGFREDVNRLRQKASPSDLASPEARNLYHISTQLGDIVDAVDKAIAPAAPGYTDYMKNYAEASRPIEEMEVLQKHEGKLYDAQNRMTYNKVQTMMRNIVDSRQAPGLNPYKSITDDTMQKLWALRDDLRRSASAQELAKTPGSDTTQTMMDTLKGIGKTGANVVVHGAILSKLGPVGNVLYNSARSAFAAGAEARAAQRRTARGMSLLHPDESKLRNPLQSP